LIRRDSGPCVTLLRPFVLTLRLSPPFALMLRLRPPFALSLSKGERLDAQDNGLSKHEQSTAVPL